MISIIIVLWNNFSLVPSELRMFKECVCVYFGTVLFSEDLGHSVVVVVVIYICVCVYIYK